MAIATLNLGNVFWCRGQLPESQELYERYRDLSRKVGYREGEALAAGNLGNIHTNRGRLAEAKRHFEQALAISAETGDRPKIALFETSLAQVEFFLGHPDRSRDHARRSLEMAREIGMPREEATALCALSDLVDNPRELREQALAIFRRIGDQEGETRALFMLSRFEEALELARANADREISLGCLAALGREDEVDFSPTISVIARMRAHRMLHRATGRQSHLDRAESLLDELRRHAPPEDRDSVLTQARP